MSKRTSVRNVLESIGLLLQRSTIDLKRGGRPRILVDIRDKIESRTTRELIILFDTAGLDVSVCAHLNRRTLSIARMLKWHNGGELVWQGPASVKPEILCSDDRSTTAGAACKKIIHLRYDYGPRLELAPGHFAMPIPMHPQIYVEYDQVQRLDAYRRRSRTMRIFFAGNHRAPVYNNPLLGELFGKLTRSQVLDHLEKNGLAKIVQSEGDLESLLHSDYWNGFVLADQDRWRIDQARWLERMSEADFFLCVPGLLMPWCHNAAEAMAVGTIPLTNYPDWFFPNLTDMNNAIVFSTLVELDRKVQEVLAMDRARIDDLRRRVIEYYSENMSPRRFVEKMLQYPDREVYLHIWDEDERVMRRVAFG